MLAHRARLFAAYAAAMLTACGTEERSAPPVFGGQGAVIAAPPKETPLPPEAPAARAPAGPCAGPSPPGDVALIDDFEDGDARMFKAFEREGYWFSASDKTEGSKLYPPGGSFAPDKLPPGQATKTNLFAAHLTAQGETQWGAVWGTSLYWAQKGVRCAFNASPYVGIKFRAKGPAVVRVGVSVPETVPPDEGGTCTAQCYDAHGMKVFLTDRWDDYLVRWDRLQQIGFGPEVRFTPARIVKLTYSVGPKDLPADFWIDDIELVPAATAR